MSKRERRNHTPAFKKVALAADRTLVQLAEQFDGHLNQIASQKAQLKGGAAESRGWQCRGALRRCQVAARKIGELTLENDFLEGELTKAGLLSAKGRSTVSTICRSPDRRKFRKSAAAASIAGRVRVPSADLAIMRVPPSPSVATRSIHICWAAWRSHGRIRSGPWTSPTFRWARGFVYLTIVLDWATRRVLSWRLSITMEAPSASEDALTEHGKPEIFNTDQGSQFVGAAFSGVLADNGIAICTDDKGAWRDNVFVERLWQRQI